LFRNVRKFLLLQNQKARHFPHWVSLDATYRAILIGEVSRENKAKTYRAVCIYSEILEYCAFIQ